MKPSLPRRRWLAVAGLLAFTVVLTGLAVARAPDARAESAGTAAPTDYPQAAPEWPSEIVDLFARVPLLDEGRVKPLNTYATYALYRINYKRSCKVPVDGQSGPEADTRSIGPVEWLLDILFYPEVARTYDCFMVENDEVLNAIGLERDETYKKKRDRYSYDFLVRGRARLAVLYGQYHKLDAKSRDPVQTGVVELAQHMVEFERLLEAMDWARRSPFPVPEALRSYFDGAETADFSEIVRRAPQVTTDLRQRAQAGEDMQAPDSAVQAWQGLLATAGDGAGPETLRLFPPTREQFKVIRELLDARAVEPEALHPDEWLTPFLALLQAAKYPEIPVATEHLTMLRDLEAMTKAREDMASFEEHARSFDENGEKLAHGIGEGDKIGMEVFLFRAGLLTYPMHFYLFLALPLVAASWLFPRRQKWYDWFVIAPAILIPTAMLILGIVLRSLIRERPPMSNLYDTVLFITAFMVLSALVIELMNKKRIALFLAPIIGGLGLLLASGQESWTRTDTMPKLQAVLDTNFWLWVHVTCIAIGYAASLFTAMLGNGYVLLKVFGVKKGDPEFFRTLGRMLYGTLAFGLIFATVGTITGGIWANDSWGRFWGWDPKENGALMIVLWQLAMVHARLGGLIKTWGLAMASTVLGGIVLFSWWGVNLLGIGLHSYGFTKGASSFLTGAYIFQGIVLVVGTIWWIVQRPTPKQARA